MKTRHSLDVPFPRRAKSNPEERPFHIRALEFCRTSLPPSALILQDPSEPKRIIILCDRRAYYLECENLDSALEPEQRAFHARLQTAGIPVETVRTLEEVMLRLEQFGLPVKGVRFQESYQRFNTKVVGRGGYVHP